jgi:hypothetical protein
MVLRRSSTVAPLLAFGALVLTFEKRGELSQWIVSTDVANKLNAVRVDQIASDFNLFADGD